MVDNTGRVRQRKAGGSWTAYWWAKDPASGAWRQRTKGGFPTECQAVEHLRRVAAVEIEHAERISANPRMRLADFLAKRWLPAVTHQATGNDGLPRRASTLAWYAVAVDKWIVPHLGGTRLADLTPAQLEWWRGELLAHGGRGGRPLGGRSVQAAGSVLRTALTYAVGLGYLDANPASGLPREAHTGATPEPWTVEEARGFLAAVRGDGMYAAWLLLVARGMRRGEVAGLRWSSIDLEVGTLTVDHTLVEVGGRRVPSVPKTRAGLRRIALDDSLVAALREQRRRQVTQRLASGSAWIDSGLVFTRDDGGALLPSSLSQRFTRLCDTHGVRRIRLHDTRHTAASLMLASGVPVKVVQEMLGHSDPGITLAIYTHTTDAQHREAGAAYTAALVGN